MRFKLPWCCDDHDPGDEDRDAALARYWFPVMRPLNSGQHPTPTMGGVPFGHQLGSP